MSKRPKPKIRYGILDELGVVVRWVWSRPTGQYLYVVQRIVRNDLLAGAEPAPY